MPTNPESSPVLLDSAEEIVQGPNPILRDVRFYKIAAELNEDAIGSEPSSARTEGITALNEEEQATDIEVGIGLRTMQRGTALGVRIKFTAHQDKWDVELDVAAEFVAQEAFEVTEHGRTDFANKVGVMTLFPYIREAVGNMTQRTVGTSFILPTLRQGDINFSSQP